MQLEEAPQKGDHEQEVSLTVRQVVRRPLGVVEPHPELDTTWAFSYPDAATLGRALVAVAGLAAVVGAEREDELRATIVDGLARYRRADGSYRLENEFRFLVARAS